MKKKEKGGRVNKARGREATPKANRQSSKENTQEYEMERDGEMEFEIPASDSLH